MNKFRKIFGLLLSILMLLGFSSRFNITVQWQTDRSPTFELSNSSFLHSDKPVGINTFMVVGKNKLSQWDYKNPAWAFSAPPGSTNPVKKLTYGKMPPNFTERAKPQQLIRGAKYLAIGLNPGSGGSVELTAR